MVPSCRADVPVMGTDGNASSGLKDEPAYADGFAYLTGVPLLRISPLALPLIALLVALAACGSPRVTTNGFLFSGLDLSFLEEDGVTCEDVLAALGTPTARRHFTGEPFGNDAWFYIGQRVSYYAFLKPDVIEQRVLAVLFDAEIDAARSNCGDNPPVLAVANYGDNELRNMVFNPDATVVVGNTRTLLQELFGDIGRFSTPTVQ